MTVKPPLLSDLQGLVGKYYERCNASNPPKVYLPMEIAEIAAQAQKETDIEFYKDYKKVEVAELPENVVLSKDLYWGIKAILRSVLMKQQADESITWKTTLSSLFDELNEMEAQQDILKLTGGKLYREVGE